MARYFGAKNPYAGVIHLLSPAQLDQLSQLVQRAEQEQQKAQPAQPQAQPANNALGGMNFGGVQPGSAPLSVPLTARAPASVAANGMNVGPPEDDGQSGAGLDRLIAPLTGTALGAASPAIASASGLSELMGMGGGSASAAPSGGFGVAGTLGSGAALGLGLLAGQVGDEGLAELARAVGGIAQLSQMVGPVASAALSGNAAAMTAATAALSAAAPAAVVAAVIQMGLAAYQGVEAGNPPEQIALDTLAAPDIIASQIMSKVIDPMFHPSEAWSAFPSEVGETASTSGHLLSALAKGLPFVQSKQELAQAIAAYKSGVGLREGGFGEGSGPYELTPPASVGSRTHGMKTPEMDFGPAVTEGQRIIDALLNRLPDTYTGTDTSDPLMRNFNQFAQQQTSRSVDTPHGIAPQQYFTNNPIELESFAQYPDQFHQANRQYLSDPSMDAAAEGRQVLYGQPGYDYQAAGFPAPGKTFGVPSDYWAQLMGRPGMSEDERQAREISMLQDAFVSNDISADAAGAVDAANAGINTGGGGEAGTSGDVGGGVNSAPAGAGDASSGPASPATWVDQGITSEAAPGPGATTNVSPGGGMRTGGRVRPSEQPRQRGQRPDPARLSEMLKKGGAVNVGDDDDMSDDVPVVLTKGEVVVNKPAAERFSHELERMNEWGRARMGGFGVGAPATGDGGPSRPTGRGGHAGGFGVTGRPRDERR